MLRPGGARVLIEPAPGEAASRWAVWRRGRGTGAAWRFEVLGGSERSLDPQGAEVLAVAAVDRVGNLSAHHILKLPTPP